MKRPVHFSIILVAGYSLLLPGCLTDAPCPQYGRPAAPAIVITVWDASTGELVGSGVTGIAVVDDQSIQLEVRDDLEVTGEIRVYGPAGTYDLFLAKDGYRAWYKGDVVVTGTRCSLTSVRVRAEMLPANDGLSNGPLQPPSAP